MRSSSKVPQVLKVTWQDSVESVPPALARPALHFRYDGLAYPCCYMYDEPPVGDLKKQSVMEVWNSKEMVKLRQAHVTGDMADYPLCQTCQAARPSLPAFYGSLALNSLTVRKAVPAMEKLARFYNVGVFEKTRGHKARGYESSARVQCPIVIFRSVDPALTPSVRRPVVQRNAVAELLQCEIADGSPDPTAAIGHHFVAGTHARGIEQLFQVIVRGEETFGRDQFTPNDILRARDMTRLAVHISLAFEFFDAAEIDQFR